MSDSYDVEIDTKNAVMKVVESETNETTQVDNRPRIETDRLILRPFELSDEEAVFSICSEKEIAANTRTIPHPYPREQAAVWIKSQPEMWTAGKAAVFAVCLKSSGQLVGAVGLQIAEMDQNAELGYWVDKDHWGQGIATEASAAAVEFGFRTLELHKIHAHYMARNPASGRIMEKIGMTKEGFFPGHIRKWGQFHDVVFYGILKSDFENNRNLSSG